MAINFNDKVLIVNPTSYFIGRSILVIGGVMLAIGVITVFTDDFLLPANLWIAMGVPTAPAGAIVMWSALRKN